MSFIQQLIQHLIVFRNTIRANRYLDIGLKTVVVVLLVLVLYFDLSSNNHLGQVWVIFLQELQGANLSLLILAVVLMPFNWFAETEKWRQFVHRYEYMPRWRALMAVFTGVTFSLFTPNRVGEYGGRMLYVHPRNQWRAVVANVVGNFCQFIVLLGMGLFGTIYIVGHFDIIDRRLSTLLIIAGSAALPLMFWVYYHFELVIDFVKKVKIVQPVLPLLRQLNLGVIRQFTKAERTSILFWALLRFFIYATQYFLLLRFFGIKTGIIGGYAGISALFLLQTSIPLPPLAGLVARGNLAVLLWAQFGANEVAALAATFTLWVINLVIPALIGTFSFFHVNISKSLGYETDTINEHPENLNLPAHAVSVSVPDDSTG
ncbi:MAG: hypothetical protein RIR11_3691 [Bacteroidota bacterium]|jgi:hypothetical protein